MFWLGTTSVKPTLLRLTSFFNEGDGRFVHKSDGLIQSFNFKNFYFQVRLNTFIRSVFVSVLRIVTHVILFIGWISTWFVDICLAASAVERETVGGNKQAV